MSSVLKVDWTDAVQPKEAAACFNRVSLYYGRTTDIKECCDGFLKTTKMNIHREETRFMNLVLNLLLFLSVDLKDCFTCHWRYSTKLRTPGWCSTFLLAKW